MRTDIASVWFHIPVVPLLLNCSTGFTVPMWKIRRQLLFFLTPRENPHTKKFTADTLEEFLKLLAGFVDNHRLTIVQNSTGRGSGDMYHTPRYSVSIGPKDVMHARDHLERHNLGALGGYSSWECMISRLQLYGPVCMEVPASIYQLTKGTIYVSEDMARPIETLDLIAL